MAASNLIGSFHKTNKASTADSFEKYFCSFQELVASKYLVASYLFGSYHIFYRYTYVCVRFLRIGSLLGLIYIVLYNYKLCPLVSPTRKLLVILNITLKPYNFIVIYRFQLKFFTLSL